MTSAGAAGLLTSSAVAGLLTSAAVAALARRKMRRLGFIVFRHVITTEHRAADDLLRDVPVEYGIALFQSAEPCVDGMAAGFHISESVVRHSNLCQADPNARQLRIRVELSNWGSTMQYSALKWKTVCEEGSKPEPGGWREAEVSVELPIRPRGGAKDFTGKVKIGTPIRSGTKKFSEGDVTTVAKGALEAAARKVVKWHDDFPEDKGPTSAEVAIRFRKELLAFIGAQVPGSRVN